MSYRYEWKGIFSVDSLYSILSEKAEIVARDLFSMQDLEETKTYKMYISIANLKNIAGGLAEFRITIDVYDTLNTVWQKCLKIDFVIANRYHNWSTLQSQCDNFSVTLTKEVDFETVNPYPQCEENKDKISELKYTFQNYTLSQEELIAKYNKYAKFLILDSEYDERKIESCDKTIMQLNYYLMGNERLRFSICYGWSNVAFGDWKGRLNITEPLKFFTQTKMKVYNKTTNVWEDYLGDKTPIEYDFENIINAQESRMYLESLNNEIKKIKTDGITFTDNTEQIVLGGTLGFVATNYKTMTLDQVLNLSATELIGKVGDVKDKFMGAYTHLSGLTATGLANLSTSLRDAVVVIGSKYFIPFLALSSSLDAPEIVDFTNAWSPLEENAKTGDVEEVANDIKVVDDAVMQDLINTQELSRAISKAIATEFEGVEMKVAPVQIAEGSAININTQDVAIPISNTSLIELPISNANLIDMPISNPSNLEIPVAIPLDSSIDLNVANKSIPLDSTGQKVTLDTTGAEITTKVTGSVNGTVSMAEGQVVDANMVYPQVLQDAIVAQGTFANAQNLREQERVKREEVAHNTEYVGESAVRNLEGQNAQSAKETLWDSAPATEESTVGTVVGSKGLLRGLQNVGVFGLLREIHSSYLNDNVRDLARAKEQEDEDEDDFKNTFFPEIYFSTSNQVSDDDLINKEIIDSILKIKIKRGISGVFVDLMDKVRKWRD